jgi:hypothetical protein
MNKSFAENIDFCFYNLWDLQLRLCEWYSNVSAKSIMIRIFFSVD